ncbi:uncharacterized protein G2W53_002066 [Senna tora]|uniref:DUF538 domain-containing protein n=1 Tax=Senna tora TaxID=362788 RepID=A0A835CKV0_9FABA|nr:uncharacterized protein G2W53_002066 [Senna tora]
MLSFSRIPFLLLPYFLFLFAFEAASASAAESTIYQVLRDHGLPMGLLPKGVKEFGIDNEGRFWVHLDQACNAKFESELHFERNVTGTLSYGQMGALSGITAQELFLWFPVKGIRVDIPSSGLIYFDVGVVRKQFSLSLFETPPECLETPSEVSDDGLQDGLLMAEAVSKSQSGELQNRLDQENFGRGVL